MSLSKRRHTSPSTSGTLLSLLCFCFSRVHTFCFFCAVMHVHLDIFFLHEFDRRASAWESDESRPAVSSSMHFCCREAFALLSSTHPLQPSQLIGELKSSEKKKKERHSRGQVTFEWQGFKHPSRSDELELFHWVKCYKDPATGAVTPADKEYPFAKYSKKVPIFRYDDDEWCHLIAEDPSWTKEETDYLLDMVEAFDMRWFAIADRYDFPSGPPRDIEDIKARYYSVARQLLLGREGSSDAIANHVLIKHPYSAVSERDRKRGIELLLKRSPEEDAEEDAILTEAAKIEAKRRAELGLGRRGGVGKALGGAEAVAAAAAAAVPIEISDFDMEPPVGTPPLFDALGKPALPQAPPEAPSDTPAPRVVARSSHARAIVASIMESIQQKNFLKAVQTSMTELRVPELPRAASGPVCRAYIACLREVIEHFELKKTHSTKVKTAGEKRYRPDDGFGGYDGLDRRKRAR